MRAGIVRLFSQTATRAANTRSPRRTWSGRWIRVS